MTNEELTKKTWELIDEHSMELSREDWHEFLTDLAADAGMRSEAVKEELAENTEDAD